MVLPASGVSLRRDCCAWRPDSSLRGLRFAHSSAAALIRIFLAVKRPDMRRVSIPIRSCNSQLLLVRIDPLPQHFAVAKPLQAGFALHAHEIGCKAVPIAAASAAAMIGAVTRCLFAGRNRLTVVIAECAGYARHEPGLVHGAKRPVELQL